MELLGALIGIGVLAAAPTVPVLRSVVKAAMKGGLAVAGATAAVAEVVGHQAGDLASHIRSDHASEMIVEGEAVSEAPPPVAPAEEAAVASETGEAAAEAGASAAAGLRPAAKSAVKSGMAVVDVAKTAAGVAAGAAGAAVVAGKQQLGGLAGGKKSQSADADAGSEASEPQAEADDVTAKPAVAADASAAGDDLVRVLGVGPKTAVLLNNAGITTFAQLAATPVEQLQAILDQAGPRYRVIDPTSWPVHAQELMNAPEPEPEPFDDSNLLPINGIGPKTAGLLKAAGIGKVSQLAQTSVERLQEILAEAGPRYRVIVPATWPEQAQALLAEAGQA